MWSPECAAPRLACMKTTMRSDLTTIELLESFWKIHWDSYSPTLPPDETWPPDRDGGEPARRSGFGDRHHRRIETPERAWHRAARRDVSRGMGRPIPARLLLTGTRARGNVWKSPDSAELVEAATWIRSHSKPARDITQRRSRSASAPTWVAPPTAPAGATGPISRRSSTGRIISGHLEEGFLTGLPSIARKLDAERIDPELEYPMKDRCGPSPTPAESSRASGSRSPCCSARSGPCASGNSSPCAAAPSAAWCTKGCGSPSTVRSGGIRGDTRTMARQRRTLPLRREDRPDQRDGGAVTSPTRVALEILEYVDSRIARSAPLSELLWSPHEHDTPSGRRGTE